MDPALGVEVRHRAIHRCEYCHFPESFAEVPFQIDHIVAQQHGGPTKTENLALSCGFCNRYKGPNLSGIDPVTRNVVRLYDPRHASWDEHFAWDGAVLVGRTDVGRATIQTLAINRTDAIIVRRWLMAEGIFPL